MEYVEKAKWPTVEDSTHEYKSLDEALQDMERNEDMNIVSSELFDENNKLIATFKKGEGVKMVEPVITVKKETLDYLQNTGISQVMRDWRIWKDKFRLCGEADIFDDLSNAMYNTTASDVIEFYISGTYDFVPVEKEYKILLPGIYRNEIGLTWEYIFLDLNANQEPKVGYTDSENDIYTFPESKLKHFPKWAQELAKEVEQ